MLSRRFTTQPILALAVAAGMVRRARTAAAAPHVVWAVADVREFQVPEPFAMVVSSAALHWITPLDRTFAALARLLVPAGQLVCALMVDGTLGELHQARRQLVPHKIPRATLPAAAAVDQALAAAGFRVHAAETEALSRHYASATDFLHAIHAQGLTGGACSQAPAPLTRRELADLIRHYDAQFGCVGGVYATYRVRYVHAERPA